MDTRTFRCPDCGSPAASPGSHLCPRCRLPLDGPEIAELWHVNAALAELDGRRAGLVHRRGVLLAALRARRAAGTATATGRQPGPGPIPGPGPAPFPMPRPAAGTGPAAAGRQPLAWPTGGQPGPGRPPKDASAPSVQTVLLVLGGLLVTIAGLVFTLVNWGHLGIGGRAAVLTALTALVLAAPFPLRRRRLTATAEAASGIGLALVLLDCYAARAAHLGGLQRLDGAAYWASATALIAAATAGYGRLTRSAVLPPAALLVAQCTAPLAAAAATAGRAGWATALLATAALDLAVALAAHRTAAAPAAVGATPVAHRKAVVATLARIGAAFWAVVGGASAADAALNASAYGPALSACLPLLLLVALGATAAGRGRELPYAARVFAAALAGLALNAALAAAPRVALPGSWSAVGHAVPAALATTAALLLVLRSSGARPRPLWAGLGLSGVFVLGMALLEELPLLLRALGEPLRSALPGDLPDGVAFPGEWRVDGAVPVVAGLVAATLGAALLLLRAVPAAADPAEPARPHVPYGTRLLLSCATVTAGVVAVALTPVAADWPYAVALAAAWLPALAAAAVLVRRPALRPAPALCGLVAGLAIALVWSLPETSAALTVWGATALLTGLLAAGVSRPAPAASGPLVIVATAFTVLALGVEAARAAAAAGLPPHLAAFAVLAVAVATAPIAAILPGGPAHAGQTPGAPVPVPASAPDPHAAPADSTTPAGPGRRQPADAGPYEEPAGPAGHPATGPGAYGRAADPSGRQSAAEPPAGRGPTPGMSPYQPAAAGPSAPLGLYGHSAGPTAAHGPYGRPTGVRPDQGDAARRVSVLLTHAVELPGYALGSAGLLMALTHPRSLSVALAVVGLAGLGVALRGDRRAGAVRVAVAALAAASWVWLALAGVGDPEPYTVTVSAVALVLGQSRARRVPGTGSWAAYGPGLGFTLLPSLVAAWADGHWLRPLLLGLGALAVTLLGARRRLRAPLLIGGAVLFADGLHELAPTIAQSLGLLPRWAPLAAVGLLLLFLGATYEHRLADGRRLRDNLRRMT